MRSIKMVVLGLLVIISKPLWAIDTYEFDSSADEQRAQELARSLRCPQCQNQNLIDSNSPIAKDIRLQVHEMADQEISNATIIAYMTERYGDFVLYQPKVTSKTYLLWIGPAALLLFALLMGVSVVRSHSDQHKKKILTGEDKDKLQSLLDKK